MNYRQHRIDFSRYRIAAMLQSYGDDMILLEAKNDFAAWREASIAQRSESPGGA